jgi:hypothetical protein
MYCLSWWPAALAVIVAALADGAATYVYGAPVVLFSVNNCACFQRVKPCVVGRATTNMLADLYECTTHGFNKKNAVRSKSFAYLSFPVPSENAVKNAHVAFKHPPDSTYPARDHCRR